MLGIVSSSYWKLEWSVGLFLLPLSSMPRILVQVTKTHEIVFEAKSISATIRIQAAEGLQPVLGLWFPYDLMI